MGELHICFNFLNVISQHMESAGLDDPWTEASLYAANSTDTMLDGKAYYCAMRGHQLTYEGLWHIKWPMHESWLAENGHEHDVEVKELAQTVATLLKKTGQNHRAELCNAVGQLSYVLRKADMELLKKTVPEVHAEFADGNFVVKKTKRSQVPPSSN